MTKLRRKRDGEHGQIMVMFTLVIVLLMVLASVVIDLGMLRTDSAQLRNALDAASLAGAYDLPAKSTNVVAITAEAKATAKASYARIGSTDVPDPTVTYACMVGYIPATKLPRVSDERPNVCVIALAANVVATPGNPNGWTCLAGGCWAPCDPAAGDICNTIIVADSANRPYTFGRAVGINSGNTGTITSAACNGACGGENPVDVVLTVDRTGSMQGLEATLVNGAYEVLKAYNPDVQHVALGMLGPSSQITACSTGAMGNVLVAATLTAPAIAGSTAANVQSAANVTAGAATLVISKPTSTGPGDFLVAGITVSGGTNTTITPPATGGWNLIRRTDNTTVVSIATYYKWAVAGEPANYTWGLSPNAQASGGILRYTGVNPANPIDVSLPGKGSGTAVAPAIVTTNSDQEALVGFYGIATNTTFTNANLTERFDVPNVNAAGPTTEGATGTQATAGATIPAKTANVPLAGTGTWVAQLIALNPVPVDTYPSPPGTTAPDYPATTPAYTPAFINANMGMWIPVGLTGTSNADVIQSYLLANGSPNPASTIVKTLGCVLPPNALTSGTDQASPFDFAKQYLAGAPGYPGHARAGVTTGIIFETDGTPQTHNYTCLQAQTAANAAKAANIEVFTIGFFASNPPSQACPDSSGFWHGKTVLQSLAAMATNSATVNANACDPTENTDKDHLFCVPSNAELATAFLSAAQQLAAGSKLVQLYPIPLVTGVGPAGGASAGGTAVTITGQFFTGASSVTFGGTGATFTLVDGTTITATAPAGTPNGTVDIRVTTGGGTSPIVGADRYTYGP